MAHNISIPFLAFRIHFQTGEKIIIPFGDKNVVRLGQPFEIISGKYAEIVQSKLLNKGKLQQLMREFNTLDFESGKLKVSFIKSKDEFTYPEFELEFDYFYSNSSIGKRGIIPTLGVEAFAEPAEDIENQLIEAIRIEFARKKRLIALQEVVAAIWFDRVTLLKETLDLKVLSPAEVEEISVAGNDQMLPKAAQLLDIQQPTLYGLENELEQVTKALRNRFNRSILLVGPSGVGKTTLVWELARHQKKQRLKGQIWETTASTLIKELTGDTGAWEQNMGLFCKELAGSDNILFVRNLMELFEVGQYSGNNVSLADYLRNPISRGEVVLLSECTEEELARIEIKSSNFLSFFQIIRIQEPRKELETIILQKVKDLATDRKITISEDAIQEVIRLHRRFVPYAGMPGRPIRFLESMLLNKRPLSNAQITRSEVVAHFCEETGMPIFMVDPAVPMNMRQVKGDFHANVFGQDKAVDSVVNILTSVKTALARTGKPIASFLFIGPTGVGKTELAKVLAQFMFGNRQRMTRFDMSEFSDPYTVMRLIGTDYFSDGLLTSAVRREPFCVLLFDEIEKANATFYDLLLQILSEGRLTDNQGKVVNFCSTIIIMTSNIGAESLQNSKIGWSNTIQKGEAAHHFLNAVQKHFRPELFNRMDEVIPFEPLDPLTIRFVVEREIQLFRQREGIRYRRMDLNIEASVLDFIGEKGYHPRYGARYLQRVLRERLILPLSKTLNHYDPDDHLLINLTISDNDVKFEVQDDPLGLELLIEELEKMSQANHASSLRRQINRLQDGHLYARLLSELDHLEFEKKQKKFWKNTLKVSQYTDFLQIKSKVEELSSEMETLETTFSMSSLGMQSYEPQLIEKVDTWEKSLFDTKLQLYSGLHPQHSICFVGIYGTALREVVQFYQEIFQQKHYMVTAQTIWFRESYYNKTITNYENGEENAENQEKRAEYIKLDCNLDESWYAGAEQSGDKLHGIEFTIFGPAAYLYLKAEAGAQRWKLSNDFDHTYILLVENEVFATPNNIHRKDFYNGQPVRRLYEPPQLRDNNYKINREISKLGLAATIADFLEIHFRVQLDEAIF